MLSLVVERMHILLKRFSRIGECGSVRDGCHGQLRRFNALASHEMADGPPAEHEIVGNDPPVTAPPDRFGTHYGTAAVAAEFQQAG